MTPNSQSPILLLDGGIGTELYERGFYINRPFEELNLNSPSDVIAVHEAYVQAGAQVLTLNTFSANGPQLKKFDIEGQLEALLKGALKCANVARRGKRPTAKDHRVIDPSGVSLALSVGPLGVLVEPLGAFGLDEARSEFERVAKLSSAAAEKDAENYAYDAYILETFTNLSELGAAIDGIRRADSIRPIIASLSAKSSQVDLLAAFAKLIGGRSDVQYLGLNCSEGPSDLLTSLQKLRPLTKKPILVQPNAGTPRHLNGRYFYMTSPDYMAKYAKRFIEAGAQGIGGCCGTGPDHIRAIRSAVRMLSAQLSGGLKADEITLTSIEVHDPESLASPVSHGRVHTPLKDRTSSFVGQKLSSKKKVLSVEILPPKGTDTKKFMEGVQKLAAAGVELVNVPDGARAMTRVGSLHIASWIQREMKGKMRVMPHFTTRDRNLIALQSDLLGAYLNGVGDILMITGDPPKLGNNREATAVYDIDSIGLTYLADCLNRGTSPNGESLGQGTGFGIGVAANPTATNLETELKRWGYKVESGADFAVTQPIFDPKSFLEWREKTAKMTGVGSLASAGSFIRPHVVGIWPLVSLRNAEFMANEVPGVHVPKWVLDEMEKAGTDKKEAEKRGIDIALQVMRELESFCEGFCVSAPLGRIEIVEALLSAR